MRREVENYERIPLMLPSEPSKSWSPTDRRKGFSSTSLSTNSIPRPPPLRTSFGHAENCFGRATNDGLPFWPRACRFVANGGCSIPWWCTRCNWLANRMPTGKKSPESSRNTWIGRRMLKSVEIDSQENGLAILESKNCKAMIIHFALIVMTNRNRSLFIVKSQQLLSSPDFQIQKLGIGKKRQARGRVRIQRKRPSAHEMSATRKRTTLVPPLA